MTALEGLGTPEAPGPLQQAFIDEQAMQCGFCTPGFVVACKAFLDRHPHPTAEDIRQTAGSRQITYWSINDACPPSPGRCTASWQSAGAPTSFTGAFNFCRIMFASNRREKRGWDTDYPGADINFSIRLAELLFGHRDAARTAFCIDLPATGVL